MPTLLVAATVCLIGVYGSFSIAQHAGRSEGALGRRWAAVSILAAGSTAWATHMIALLAFRPGIQSGFEPFLTTLSLVLVVLGIGAGMAMTVGRHGRARRFAGGVVIGVGVAFLHYVGQAAYVVRGKVSWDLGLVAFSILVGLPLFGLSLLVAGERNRKLRPLGAPLLLLSIAVLHLGGMTALRIDFDPRVQLPRMAISPEVLAPVVAAICFALLAAAVVGLRLTLHAKAALRRERIRLGELANLALEGLAICEGNRIVTANDSLAKLCGLRREDLTGRLLTSLVPDVDPLEVPEHEEADAEIVAASGKRAPVRILRSAVRLGGRPQTVIAFRDQRERLRSEARIRMLAFSDSLTGLANRPCFHDALGERVSANRVSRTPFTLLLFDLDGFKSVNDAFGHAGGDEVLQVVSNRVREIVGELHLLSRLGGDEFAILVDGSADPVEAAALGRRIISAIEVPIRIQQQVAHVSASVGIMPSQLEPIDAGEMLTAADLALYDAKENGRARVRLFTPELKRAASQRSKTAHELDGAWESSHFELYYQPQVDLLDDRVVGAEALIRWNSSHAGVLAPGAFLPVLESSHLAIPVGNWIMGRACRQAAEWRGNGLSDFRIGVNLFAAQLRMPDFVEQVEDALRQSGLAPEALELEITENIVLSNERTVSAHLKRLRRMGIGIAFDDFGTGFASLTLLKQLDITRLKIDRSFVREIETDRKDQAIVDAVVRMAEGCDLAVIAEGIETRGQASYLRERVAEGQGYLFGRPLTAGSFTQAFATYQTGEEPEERKA
ncbi:bifunctional diguanylate cyclase/phosphodiesterase [Aureimonas psammosilenae]|uniref:bifunctional diguanylate cyclase/phosphodiesterase n=1 Tax=Aureimonas psammosilenae TaxID=2495496 RepID=UPI00186A555D|nr:EAL domain-containing protein [Aureimonas psammosilenae]